MHSSRHKEVQQTAFQYLRGTRRACGGDNEISRPQERGKTHDSWTPQGPKENNTSRVLVIVSLRYLGGWSSRRKPHIQSCECGYLYCKPVHSFMIRSCSSAYILAIYIYIYATRILMRPAGPTVTVTANQRHVISWGVA